MTSCDNSKVDESASSSPSVSTSAAMPQAKFNKYTGRPFSAKFWQILDKRKNLPVWDYYTRFSELVKENKVVVLVGETGSGKTTQVLKILLYISHKYLSVTNFCGY